MISAHGASRGLAGDPGVMDHRQLLASIAATTYDCIVSLDAAGTVVWASPATEGLLGWRPEELVGRGSEELFPTEDRALRAAARERLRAGDRVEPFLDTAVSRAGDPVRVQVVLGPVHGPGGEMSGVLLILRDVSEQLAEQRELALALEMSRAHFDQSPTPQAIVDLDGRLESVNPAWCELFGLGEGWFADSALLDLVHHTDTDAVAGQLRRLTAGEVDSARLRGVFRAAGGDELPLTLEAALLREPGGRPYAVAASAVDLDDLPGDGPRFADALTRAVVESPHEGILATAADGRIVFANETAAYLLGSTVTGLVGARAERVLDHLPGEDGAPGEPDVREVGHVRPDGSEVVLDVSRRPLNSRDSRLGWVYSITDVTEARRTESALRRQALHDPVTSLPNRYLFRDRLDTAVTRQRRSATRGTAVLFIDLDRFKEVNDRHGHAGGDELLRGVASRLVAAVRASDTVARLGGDEFAVICEDAGPDEALLVAERILGAFEAPVLLPDCAQVARLSIGAALLPPYDAESVVDAADRAMYRAKHAGGHRVALAEPDL